MEVISNTEFGGERPLFESHNLRLENVVIRAGESAIKECSNIEAIDCRFEGNYPFWHVHGFVIDRCFFDIGGRSALWYSDHLKMTDTRIDAPKMFREMHDIEIENVEMNDADEVFWRCQNLNIKNLKLHGGTYPFMFSSDIRIDGYSIKDVTLDSLRGQVGIVPQETMLFNGSVYDNILYGRLDATPDEVKAAAKAANADEFISQLPQGYATMLGDRGVNISGGQRQRISIARAILKNPRILILDEATSALDTESERVVQDALDRLMIGRTSFVIAHRLSTIKNADKILVLEHGALVEAGTHDELIAKNGLYAHLYQIQYRSKETK